MGNLPSYGDALPSCHGPPRLRKGLPDYNVDRLEELGLLNDGATCSTLTSFLHPHQQISPGLYRPVSRTGGGWPMAMIRLAFGLNSRQHVASFRYLTQLEDECIQPDLPDGSPPKIGLRWSLNDLTGHGWLASRPQAVLLLVRFPDLETRCLAAMCRTRFGIGTLAEVALHESDLNQHVANVLDLNSHSFPQGPGHQPSAAQLAAAASELLLGTGLKLSNRILQGWLGMLVVSSSRSTRSG